MAEAKKKGDRPESEEKMEMDKLRDTIACDIFETLTERGWPGGEDVGELAECRMAAERLLGKYVFVPRGTEAEQLRDAIAGEVFESFAWGYAWPRDAEADDLADFGKVAGDLLKKYVVVERPPRPRLDLPDLGDALKACLRRAYLAAVENDAIWQQVANAVIRKFSVTTAGGNIRVSPHHAAPSLTPQRKRKNDNSRK